MSQPSPEDLKHLRICGTCYSVYAPAKPCLCPLAGAPEGRVALCQCCGLEPIAVGTQHAFLCATCEHWVIGASVWDGRRVVEIGQSTIHHRWPKRADGTQGHVYFFTHGGTVPVVASLLRTRLRDFHFGEHGLYRWYRHLMAANWKRLSLHGRAVTLADYLAAIERSENFWTWKFEAFQGLCKFQRTNAHALSAPKESVVKAGADVGHRANDQGHGDWPQPVSILLLLAVVLMACSQVVQGRSVPFDLYVFGALAIFFVVATCRTERGN